MLRDDFIEAIKSQRNRYDALYELAIHCLDIDNNSPAYLYTLTEDTAEYARQLMFDVCGQNNENNNG